MNKKNIFVGIGCLIVMALTINFNVSQSNHNSDISLLSIEAMTNAAAECDDTTTDGLACHSDINNNPYCIHGGEVGSRCKYK